MESLQPTSRQAMDAALARLREGATVFARLPLSQRVSLARSMRDGYARIARGSVEAACAAKGIRQGTPAAGEEWLSGPVVTLTHLRQWLQTLRSIARSGTTPMGRIGETIDGRPRVQAYPRSALDRAVSPSLSAEVHLQAGARVEERARFYREEHPDGRVVLVLGAGNVNAIPPLDVATKLFNEGKVCVLKMHPVNAYLGPLLEEAFRDAIRQRFLAVVYGGAEEGAYLASHREVDEVHLTGSERTYDALVFGPPGPDQDRRKALRRPLLDKPVTSELGNVSPVIVVPGRYSDRQLRWQADHIAGGVTNNASFNCNANKLIVTGRSWSQGRELLSGIEAVLAETPVRRAYYPGAADRFSSLVAGHPGAILLGARGKEGLPWTILPDLDPRSGEEEAFRTTRALERALVDLRYGTVAVNLWAGWGFGIGTPWGGHPSSALPEIQSGHGFVHNTGMLEGVEKTVLRHPITSFPKPVTSASHRTLHQIGPPLTALQAGGDWLRLPQLLAAALRG